MKNIDVLELMDHFGLERDPFGKACGDQVFQGKMYQKALKMAAGWIRTGEMGAIIGTPGSGKTTLINGLTDYCESEGDVVLVHVGHPARRKVQVNCIYEAIKMELAEYGAVFSHNNQLRSLELRRFLGELDGRRVGIVIDEAHRMTWEFIRGVKEFTEMRYGARQDLLGVIFVGQPYFLDHVRRGAPDIHMRLKVGHRIIDAGKLAENEVKEYLRFRAKMAGNARLFDEGALNALALIAKNPLKANDVAWKAMDAAFIADDKTVRLEHVIGGFSMQGKKEILGPGCTEKIIAENTGLAPSSVGSIVREVRGNRDGNVDKVDSFLDKAIRAGGIDNMPARKAS